jgi:hypothetical protein
VSENTVLRRIFDSKKEEITGEIALGALLFAPLAKHY